MDPTTALSRPARRLYGEMSDDGVVVEANGGALGAVLDELDYGRRPRVFERRTPLYGAFVVPDDRSLVGVGELVDVVDLDHLDLDTARRFSDGRSTYLVRHLDGSLQLACFRRSVQYEADMVEIQDNTGAFIVQRTVMGVVRLFGATGTVEWTGSRWATRPSASTQYAQLGPQLPQIAGPVLAGMLKLALHWLSPGRVGATLVVHAGAGPWASDGPGGGTLGRTLDGSVDGLDLEHSITAPALSVTARHHYSALFAALSQTDLAVLIDPAGAVQRVGVGLRSSTAAENAVDDPRGMRHRSAARYTFDHADAVALVVSEDGPVTVFHRGHALSECAASAA